MKTEMEAKAENYALNQWLSDYPIDWDYSKIIECLNHDCRNWGMFVMPEDEDNDDAEKVSPWQTIEDFDGDQIAEFIEDTKRSMMRFANELHED